MDFKILQMNGFLGLGQGGIASHLDGSQVEQKLVRNALRDTVEEHSLLVWDLTLSCKVVDICTLSMEVWKRLSPLPSLRLQTAHPGLVFLFIIGKGPWGSFYSLLVHLCKELFCPEFAISLLVYILCNVICNEMRNTIQYKYNK